MQKMWGNEYRTTMVCVDSYENRVLAGRFYNQYCPEGVRFESLIDLLKKMEDMLDRMRFPQPFASVRTFAETPMMENGAPEGAAPREGACATFEVRVLFRQNASWQGSVTWLDGRREESFRSVLELIFLMDSAIYLSRKNRASLDMP